MADQEGGDLADTIYQAFIMQAEGKTAEAEAAYRQILDAEPDQPDVLHFLGTLEFQKGNMDAAIELVTRAIGVDGENAAYHSTLGQFLMNSNRHAEAEESFRTAVTLAPDSAELHFNLGETLRLQGKYSEAEASYRKTYDLQPN